MGFGACMRMEPKTIDGIPIKLCPFRSSNESEVAIFETSSRPISRTRTVSAAQKSRPIDETLLFHVSNFPFLISDNVSHMPRLRKWLYGF